MAAAWVAVGLSAVSLISGFLGSKKSESAAQRQARIEAEQEKKLTAERIRQIGIEKRAAYGETMAGYAASGVISTTPRMDAGPAFPAYGTVSKILSEQQKEFEREISITREVGATKVQQALAGGKATADYYRYSGYANAAASLSDIFTQIAAINK